MATGSLHNMGSGASAAQTTRDFFLCDFFDAAPKGDLASREHPLFSLSTRPDRRVLSYSHNDTEITITPSVKGRATIHDKDIIILYVPAGGGPERGARGVAPPDSDGA